MTTAHVPAGDAAAARRDRFREAGYVVERGVLGGDELDTLADHYGALHATGGVPGCFEVRDGPDPAAAWPRMLQPHRVDAVSMRLLLDPRLLGAAAALWEEPALGLQTMWYWKPPGTLGQALHQDEYYVRTRPGDCLAAWVAIDAADAGNGCLRVVPGSHLIGLLPPHAADPTVSSSRHEVDVPAGHEVVDVRLDPGDVLFFHGRLIHGSMPNRSADRWRRAFVAHYVPATSTSCDEGYQPLYDATGREVRLGGAGGGTGPGG